MEGPVEDGTALMVAVEDVGGPTEEGTAVGRGVLEEGGNRDKQSATTLQRPGICMTVKSKVCRDKRYLSSFGFDVLCK